MELKRPTLLLDREKCLSNLQFMVKRAAGAGIQLRPHFKTHQSLEIGRWFSDAGVQAVTVSSVKMLTYFASGGWKNFTLALPLNIHELDLLNELDAGISVNLLLSSHETARQLVTRARRPFGYYVKIDTGYGRCGLTPAQTGDIEHLMAVCAENSLLTPLGFLSHFGHTYKARSHSRVREIYTDGVRQLRTLRDTFTASGTRLGISVGDTPSCSLVTDFMDVTEIRPGNFIFYDAMQQQIGSCSFSQIAIGLACPVIEVHPEREEAVIFGGAVHFSKDYILDDKGNKVFGLIAFPDDKGWGEPLPDCYVKNLSQEHGIVHVPAKVQSSIKPGRWIVVLPVHSCLTADAMGCMMTLDGQQIEMMDKKLK